MIFSKVSKGDLVTYIGSSKEQVNWGTNDNPDGVLIRGNKYVVELTEVHTSHTKVKLEGFDGYYNSVSFLKND